MPTVLITRPLNAASELASELGGYGYECIIEPMLTIIPTFSLRPTVDKLQAVMFTSRNALFALKLASSVVDDLLNLPCFCVGPRTSRHAADFGFRHIQCTNSDGAELAQFMSRTLSDKTSSILHIVGQEVDNKAQNYLELQGYNVITWSVYKAVPALDLTPSLVENFTQHRLSAVLLYSPRSAQALVALMEKAALQACCKTMIAIGLSETVVEALKPIAWRNLVAAPAPTEDAVIECLRKMCPV